MLLELGVIVTGGTLTCAQPDTWGSELEYSLAWMLPKNFNELFYFEHEQRFLCFSDRARCLFEDDGSLIKL